MPELRSPGKLPDPRRLFLRGGFQFGDALGADLMDDAPQFLDAPAQPCQLFLADLVVPGITGLSVGLFQLLEHRALAVCGVMPDAIEPEIKPFCKRTQEGEILVVRRKIGRARCGASVCTRVWKQGGAVPLI